MNEPRETRKPLLILDASVIINFLIINRWPILLRNQHYQVASPKLIIEEIKKPPKRKHLVDSVNRGELLVVDEAIPNHILALIPGWFKQLGQHDTAVLVNAVVLNASIAADDRRLVREATGQGVNKILGTEALLAEAVKQAHFSLLSGNQHLTDLRRQKFHSRYSCLC